MVGQFLLDGAEGSQQRVGSRAGGHLALFELPVCLNGVDAVLAESGASRRAVSYARGRAADLAVAAQHEVRFDAYILDTLRAAELDTAPVTA
ncbi:hypothetical protein [Streptomyces sasae]|uniref:hypothetical protein n=1 Tax=Streptomyces sasae TaxID=1266772 RepID=UPI00292E2855|nr:hypothetical protein [Streptomyces sasae]